MERKEPQVVLVVEDDPSALAYFQRLLEEEGHKVLCARSAGEAAALLKRAVVALAVVDYRLPDGSGGDVLYSLREANPDAQSIIVTGYGSRDVVLESMDEGAFSFLNKPVEGETLLDYCRRALHVYRLKRENSTLQGHMKKYTEELTLRNRELDAISRITGLASAQRELGSGCESEVLDVVRETLSADAALLYGQSGADGELVLRNHRGLTGPEEGALARLDPSLGLVGRVAGRRKIVAAENVASLPVGYAPQAQAPVETPDLRVVLGCPLASKGWLMGVLLAAYRAPRPIGQFHRVLIASLGRQLSIAMENVLLSEMAAVDGLTSLFNRRYFDQRLAQEVSRAGRHGRPMALCLADVDRFQALGSAFGPFFGDRVLQGVSRCVQALIRRSDVAARYGEGEMAVVLPETGMAGARRVAEKLRQTVEELRLRPEAQEREAACVTLSIGLSSFPSPGETPEKVLRQADEALGRAKTEGCNRVVCFGE